MVSSGYLGNELCLYKKIALHQIVVVWILLVVILDVMLNYSGQIMQAIIYLFLYDVWMYFISYCDYSYVI